MQITQEMLDRFVNGQIEIKNEHEEYIFRAGISTLPLSGNFIWFGLHWFVRGENYPSHPLKEALKWKVVGELGYCVDLSCYNQEIKFNLEDGKHNILQLEPISNEDPLITFFTKDDKDNQIDPEAIEGLNALNLEYLYE